MLHICDKMEYMGDEEEMKWQEERRQRQMQLNCNKQTISGTNSSTNTNIYNNSNSWSCCTGSSCNNSNSKRRKYIAYRKHLQGKWSQLALLLLPLLLLTTMQICSAYLIIVQEQTEPGTVIFNASVYKLGSERHYKINAHKSAHFVHHLVTVNHKDGQIQLKKPLKCDGIYYPNLFTFYVDSTSNRLRSIDYYSLPIRIFVTGDNCNDDRRIDEDIHGRQYEEEDTGYSRRRRRRYIAANVVTLAPTHKSQMQTIPDYTNNEHNHTNFREGDLIFGNTIDNEMRHNILSRKRRDQYVMNLEPSVHQRISEAKQWISETYASYAIHTTDKWNQICLRKSQFINNLNAFMPKSICQYCKVNFLDVNDERFVIEHQNRDLVASRDVCIQESIWKVSITFNIRCERHDFVDSDHRLKIVYHRLELL